MSGVESAFKVALNVTPENKLLKMTDEKAVELCAAIVRNAQGKNDNGGLSTGCDYERTFN